MPPELLLLPRAGFWRRLGAFAIDLLIGSFVIAMLGTLAFSLSDGRVQTSPLAVTISNCIGVTEIPADLIPSPPTDSNYASDCSIGSFPGMTMTRALLVGQKVTSPGRVVDMWQSYPLAADGSRVAAFDATWIGQLGFAVYLVSSLYLRGSTLGMRLLRIRLVSLIDPERVGVPLPKVLIRAAVAIAGVLPAIVLGMAAIVWTKHDPEHAPGIALLILTWIAATIWILWNAVLIARKLDPVYDRISRLAVVRV